MLYVVYVFDVYGMFFDVYVVVCCYVGDVGFDGQFFFDVWCFKQFEYFWVCVLMGGYQDFWVLIEQVLDYVFWCVLSVNKGFCDWLLQVYWKFDCYLEVLVMLKMLKVGGVCIVIFFNGLLVMLVVVVKNFVFDMMIDDIFFVDEICIFKIVLQVYDMVMMNYWFYLDVVFFQLFNCWDVVGVMKFGFCIVWINCNNVLDEYKDYGFLFILFLFNGLE